MNMFEKATATEIMKRHPSAVIDCSFCDGSVYFFKDKEDYEWHLKEGVWEGIVMKAIYSSKWGYREREV